MAFIIEACPNCKSPVVIFDSIPSDAILTCVKCKYKDYRFLFSFHPIPCDKKNSYNSIIRAMNDVLSLFAQGFFKSYLQNDDSLNKKIMEMSVIYNLESVIIVEIINICLLRSIQESRFSQHKFVKIDDGPRSIDSILHSIEDLLKEHERELVSHTATPSSQSICSVLLVDNTKEINMLQEKYQKCKAKLDKARKILDDYNLLDLL